MTDRHIAYVAAMMAYDQAMQRFRELSTARANASKLYRARLIGDAEFLAASDALRDWGKTVDQFEAAVIAAKGGRS